MKIICLMPCKNEVDILPITLKVLSQYCDNIIIADQMSDDGSREIYKQFSKVKVIDNTRTKHSNQTRWDLLKEARKIDGNNLMICLDADEFIPPKIFKNFIESNEFKIGDSFAFPWIQLWKSVDYYNKTGVWYKNYQRIAWVDDGVTDYEKIIDIIDDLPRIPTKFLKNCKRIKNTPILHLQWIPWKKTQTKQAWYRCIQLINPPHNYKEINKSYYHSLDEKPRLTKISKEWFDDLKEFKKIETVTNSWHLRSIIDFFDKYGIEFFEPLQIWHIKELEDEFIKRVGRKPKSETTSPLVALKRKIKQLIINSLKNIKYGF